MNFTSEEQRLLKAALFQTVKLYDDLGLSQDLAEETLVTALCTILAGRHSKDRVAFDAAVARHLRALRVIAATTGGRIPEAKR